MPGPGGMPGEDDDGMLEVLSYIAVAAATEIVPCASCISRVWVCTAVLFPS